MFCVLLRDGQRAEQGLVIQGKDCLEARRCYGGWGCVRWQVVDVGEDGLKAVTAAVGGDSEVRQVTEVQMGPGLET